jgi:hypothetical protein
MDPGHPWASLPIVEDKQTTIFFNDSVQYVLGNGTSFLFWADPWLHGQRLVDIAPDLVNAVPAWHKRQWLVADALNDMAWASNISGALTIPVLVQYVLLYQCLQASAT